ncbi:MAG: hypothetical protein KGD66_09245, partial [Candidatus Lokiarchaeota archaeon]|nr:hypothetical protein [Candidatus Lokiarchaeota archaeon]
MTTGIIYDDIYLSHQIGAHVESHLRLVTIMDFLKQQKLLLTKLILASLPVVAAGLLFEETVIAAFKNPVFLASGFWIT